MSSTLIDGALLSLRHAAGTSLVLSMLATAVYAQEECPAGAEDCYPYRSTRIDLRPSTAYETVTLPRDATDEDIEALRFLLEEGGVGEAHGFGSLADAPAILIRFRDTIDNEAPELAARERVEDIVTAFNRERFAGRGEQAVTGLNPLGNPVYASGDADFIMVNEFVIQFTATSSEAERREVLERHGAEVIADHGARNWYVVTFTRLTAREALRASNTIHYEELVEFAEPNFVSLMPRPGAAAPPPICPAPGALPLGPVDPLFVEQWYLDNDGSGGGTPFADINATRAWQVTTGSDTVVIAVVDDGVSRNHVDLGAKMVSGFDAYGGDGTPNPWDGHGTAVAGIAAAVTGNPYGIKGIGADVLIMPVRVMQFFSADHYVAHVRHDFVRAGIEAAADRAQVLNNSWALSESPQNSTIESGIDYALGRGRVLVFAAGNQGSAVRYPARLSISTDESGRSRPIIAVGATDRNDVVVDWSNYGDDRVTVVAPGLGLITTDMMETDGDTRGYCLGDYVIFSGTSAAAPLVSGTAALMLSADPTLSPTEVRARLESTAQSIGSSAGYDQRTGHGRIDACRALDGADCRREFSSTRPIELH
jgi:thermitase